MKTKRLNIDLYNLGLFLYFCALSGHQREIPIDKAITIATFFIFIVSAVFKMGSRRLGEIQINKFTLWYAGFMLFSFCSVIWAQYSTSEVFFYFNRQMQLLLVTICLPIGLRNEKDIDDRLLIFIYSLLYAGLLLVIRTPISDFGTEIIGEEIGLNRNLLGTRMAVGVLILLYLFNKYPKKKYYILIMLFFTVLAFWSGSKKAVIMLAIGVFGIEIFASNSKKVSRAFLRMMIALIILGGGAYLIFNNSYFSNVLGARLVRTYNFLTGVSTFDHSTQEREYYMSVAQSLFKNNPILGVGLNNFKAYIASIGYSHVAYSHNNYWELLSCVGIVGTLLFYSMPVAIFYKLWLYIRKYRSPLGITFFFILATYLICDYANVSFMNIFQYAIICLMYKYIQLVKRGAIT